MAANGAGDGGADVDVLWRALPVARAVLFGYALTVNAVHADDYEHAPLAWVVLGVLGIWSTASSCCSWC